MARIDTYDHFLTDVADSIREKKGTAEPILAKNFDTEIKALSGSSTGDDFYINNCSYLFYGGARFEQQDYLLGCCKDVYNVSHMFDSNTRIMTLDLSNLDLSLVVKADYMFKSSRVYSLILKGDTKKLNDISNIFANCGNLNDLVLEINTSQVTSFSSMFNGCSKLENLDLSNIDFAAGSTMNWIFNYCSKLTNLIFGLNFGKGYKAKTSNTTGYTLDLSTCNNLTHDSLMSVINNLYDLNLTYGVANGGTLYTQKLVLGSTNLAKLTQTEIQIATNKGWTVS